jgi:hypothetical protein
VVRIEIYAAKVFESLWGVRDNPKGAIRIEPLLSTLDGRQNQEKNSRH